MQRQTTPTTSTDALLSALLDMPDLENTSKLFVMAEEKSGEALSEAITLTTPLKSADGQQIGAIAKFCLRDNATIKKAYVFASTAPDKSLGYVQYTLLHDDVYIDYIKNTQHLTHAPTNCYKYVGTALHEVAFRESVAHGKQGQVSLYALTGSHVFHADNGFEPEKADCVPAFRQKIIKDKMCYQRCHVNHILFNDAEDHLHLSTEAITAKMQRFGLIFKTAQTAIQPDVKALSPALPPIPK